MSRQVTDQDEIFELISADPATTEAVYRDDKGVYLLGGDGEERRYITELTMEDVDPSAPGAMEKRSHD